MPWKSKITETKSEVSNEHGVEVCANFWQLTASRNCLKTNQHRLSDEGVYLCGWWSYGDKYQGGGKRIDSYPPFSESLTHIWIQESSEIPREVIPTTSKYIAATGKQALTLLQSAASLIPVPLIKEAIGVALKIIELCEVCTISPNKGCKMVYNILLSEYICRRSKGQGPAR